jgi:hypothetical protein
MTEAGHRVGNTDRRRHDRSDQHRKSEPVDARRAAVGGNPLAQDDVDHEQRAVAEREGEAHRVTGQPGIGQQNDTRGRQHQRGQVTPAAEPDDRQRHRPDELDRADGSQRQPVDGQVEQRVHRGQGQTERHQEPPLRPAHRCRDPPRPAPHREHDRRRDDPKPSHAQRAHRREEQHRERRAEVVEHRAYGEIAVRRDAIDGHGSIVEGRYRCQQVELKVGAVYDRESNG